MFQEFGGKVKCDLEKKKTNGIKNHADNHAYKYSMCYWILCKTKKKIKILTLESIATNSLMK